MKKLSTLLLIFPLAICLAIPAFAGAANGQKAASSKEHTYYGDVSDSNCGVQHKMAGNARACAEGCVKNGAKYVFVYRGKVLPIANQDMPELAKYAGEHVKVMGTRSKGSIAIASITPVHKRSKKKA